ncbi:protein kinase [Phytophthora infestans T30-4]|uniref:Protein kinase n=1 Tax=Phytophthora infestans (strain T30-4) TaxID=403677 RepID=D0NVY7_PHYIT|nr:protein kinase [Phytophthora infestans T30-4]EEY66823.1 protein kinase [Phytophthora infestans T30-4]|eukprot:XP_002896710.1 protein kinase [Phytophthora infestans T30-4]
MDVIETDTAEVQVNSVGATSYVNSYKIMDMLGEGTFSKVYLCQNDAGVEFALKIVNKSILKRKREYKRVDGKLVLSNVFQKVQKEVAIMKKLAHSNLVRLYEVIDSPADDKLFLVLELIRGGQVMHWDDKKSRYIARNSTTGVLDKETVRECMRDVVAALVFLHRNHICHRDIKPENILLSGDRYKLADFGVAHMNEDELSAAAKGGDAAALKLRSTEGTYHFLAPECTTGDEYDPYQVDVWALGVTMFTLLSGTLPFGTSVASLSDVMMSIREDPLVLPPDLDAECAQLLTQLLEKSPHKRITVTLLKTHPWLLGAGDELIRRPSSREVMVTQQEIEAAFTPVNNFILVMKLKMKMSSRLNNARKALANNVNGTRVDKAMPVTENNFVFSSQPAEDKGDKETKTAEMAPGELPRVKTDKLQRRPSGLVGNISETVGSLTSTLTRRLRAIVPAFDSATSATPPQAPEMDSTGKADANGRPGPSMSTRNSRAIEALIFEMRTDIEPLAGVVTTEEICGDLSPGRNEARRTSLVSLLNRDKSPTKSDAGLSPNTHKLTKRKSVSPTSWDEK